MFSQNYMQSQITELFSAIKETISNEDYLGTQWSIQDFKYDANRKEQGKFEPGIVCKITAPIAKDRNLVVDMSYPYSQYSDLNSFLEALAFDSLMLKLMLQHSELGICGGGLKKNYINLQLKNEQFKLEGIIDQFYDRQTSEFSISQFKEASFNALREQYNISFKGSLSSNRGSSSTNDIIQSPISINNLKKHFSK